MSIVYGRQSGMLSEKRGATFTGEAWADAVLATQDNVTINNVFFTPGARIWWHTHEQGQILQVVAEEGLICLAGQQAQIIRTGDTIWIPAGERHWHGASQHSYLLHTASLWVKSTGRMRSGGAGLHYDGREKPCLSNHYGNPSKRSRVTGAKGWQRGRV